MISYTVFAPFIGGLIDRFGPRSIIVPGILVLSLGLILCAAISTISQFYLFYGLVVGLSMTCIGTVSYAAILTRWFKANRGLAFGLTSSGVGLGTLFYVPLVQYFMSRFGWRFSFIILASILLLIIFPTNLIFLRDKPLEMDRKIKNENQEFHEKKTFQKQYSMQNLFQSGRFWYLIAFTFFAVFGIFIILVHNVQFMVDQGISKKSASLVFGAIGAISMIFRIFWGWISDHIGREITYSIGILMAFIGVLSLMSIEFIPTKKLLLSFMIFFGMGWGVAAPIFMSASADLFEKQSFGRTYGMVEAGFGIAGALGPWIAGAIFDLTKSYQLAFLLVLIVFLLSCLFLWLAAPRKFRSVTNAKGKN
jgi:MFS family permease